MKKPVWSRSGGWQRIELDKMLNGNDKKTLYEALTALQEVMEEIEKQKSDQAKLEFKQK